MNCFCVKILVLIYHVYYLLPTFKHLVGACSKWFKCNRSLMQWSQVYYGTKMAMHCWVVPVATNLPHSISPHHETLHLVLPVLTGKRLHTDTS